MCCAVVREVIFRLMQFNTDCSDRKVKLNTAKVYGCLDDGYSWDARKQT